MERKETNLLEWVKKFDAYQFSDPNTSVQITAGWYDWFCNETSLANKTKSLGKKLKQIINSPKLNPTKQYVWFKNNCPCVGSLYDDFRIADIETGDTIYTIIPSSGHTSEKGVASVWGKENGFKEALAEGKWKDVLNYFNK